MAEGARNRIELADFLRQEASNILRRWELRVRGMSEAAHGQPRAALVDHLPRLLEHIAATAEQRAPSSSPPSSVTKQHATERLEQGYGLAEVVMEYIELRACICERLEELGLVVDAKQSRHLHRELDHALRETAGRYVTNHEKMLRALDRISGQHHAPRSLDEALTDILEALREAISASVDSVTLLLVGEDGRLHVRASVGLEEEKDTGFSLGIGEGFAGRIAQLGKPILLRDAGNDSMIVSPAIRRRGTRALYGVPLADGERVIGVAHIGSCEAFELSDEDIVLFRAMCQRATIVIIRAQLVESLVRTSRFREQFIGILGHDLRTPLNTVLGTAAIVGGSEKLDPSLRPSMQRIERSAHRMARLIEHLLDFTRARLGGGFELKRSSFSLLDLAREVTDEQLPLLSKRHLETSGEDLRGDWDHDRLAQALGNLVANAVQHSPDGSRINVSVRPDGGNAALIEVWNEGPPIPGGTRLFEPFERASESGGGLGLGLFITNEIVRAHDGSLSVRSDATGTAFTICLPMNR